MIFFILFRWEHNMKFSLYKFVSVWYIIIDCRYTGVKKISRVYSFCLTETLYPLINNYSFPSAPPSPRQPLFDFVNLTIFDMSRKKNYVFFVFLWLINFT